VILLLELAQKKHSILNSFEDDFLLEWLRVPVTFTVESWKYFQFYKKQSPESVMKNIEKMT
jgi:hypothetical protein